MKKLNKEIFDKVIDAAFLYGKNSNQAAQIAGITQRTAMGIITGFQLMRDGKLDELKEQAESRYIITVPVLTLAAEKIGCPVPEDIVQVVKDRDAERVRKQKANRKPELIEEPAPEPTAVMTVKPVEIQQANDTLYFIRILEELHQQNELLKDLLDVVIPKYVADLKDNLNANSDSIFGKVDSCASALDAIRCNTRKRGL